MQREQVVNEKLVSLESRLAVIQRRSRYQQVVTIFPLIALVALFGYGSTEGDPDEIRVRKLVAVNNDGLSVISAGTTRERHGELWVHNKKGNGVIADQADSAGDGQLWVHNKHATPVIAAVSALGNSHLWVAS